MRERFDTQNLLDGQTELFVCGVARQFQNADIFQVAISASIIQSVADYEFIRNPEANVMGSHVLNSPGFFIEQNGNAQRAGMPLQQNALEIVDRKASVEYVLHENYVEPFDAAIQILSQPDLARTASLKAVTGRSHEVDR